MELRENDVKVLRTLRDLGGTASVEEVARKTGLVDAAIARSSLTLSEQGMVKEQTTRTTEVFCTEEGHDYLANGLPERRVAVVVHDAGGKLSVSDAVEQAGLPLDFVSIGTGWIARKGWGKIEKTSSGNILAVSKNPPKDEDEEVLARIGQVSIPIEELPPNLKRAVDRLLKRNILASKERTQRKLEITPQGLNAIPAQASIDEVSSLTSEMILSGDWEKIRLRAYNVSSPVPSLNPGKYHPYLRFLRTVKRKLEGYRGKGSGDSSKRVEDRVRWLGLQVFERRSVQASPPQPRNSPKRPLNDLKGPSDPRQIFRHRSLLPA